MINENWKELIANCTEKIKKHKKVILIFALAVILLAVIGRMAYLYWVLRWVWADWTGFGEYIGPVDKENRGKTLWDWMQLLFVPIALAVVAILFNRQEKKIELQIAENRSQEAVLQNYLDKMGELILEKSLLDLKWIYEETPGKSHQTYKKYLYKSLNETQRAVHDMAQVRTIIALRQLDRERKEIVFQFLKDAGLADFILMGASIDNIDLRNARLSKFNLSDTEMVRANMSNAMLFLTNLSGANLSGAILRDTVLVDSILPGIDLQLADLRGANFLRANLQGANLHKADLSGANLTETDLTGSDVSGAILREAKINQEQLALVRSIENLILPDGSLYNPNVHTFWKGTPPSFWMDE